MKNNYFINAYKYVESRESSNLENFSTEAFVFILKYLRERCPEIAKKLFSLFGFNNISNEDLQKIQIETQKKFYVPFDFIDEAKIPVNQNEARPDITLWLYPEQLTFIEVKVDADLNWYKLKNNSKIDQVDFYANIKNCKNVYILSKRCLYKDNYQKDKLIRWYNIYEILKNLKSFIIKEYLFFLESNNMGERLKIDNKVLNLLDAVAALDSLLKNSWELAEIKGFKLNYYSYINNSGFGYYVLNENESNSATKDFSYFIGISLVPENKETYSNKIVFWAEPCKIDKKRKDLFYSFDGVGCIAKKDIDLKELINLNSVDEQENVIKEWLVTEVKPLLR